MKKSLLALAIALVPSLAWAQGAVLQNGPIVKFDLPGWVQDKTIMSGGKMFTDNLRGFNPSHFFDNRTAFGVCTEDALTNLPYSSLCMGHDANGAGLISNQVFNGAANPGLNFSILGNLGLSGTTLSLGAGGATIATGSASGLALLGTPTAPTPAGGDNSTKLATTAYVNTVVGSSGVAAIPIAPTNTALAGTTQATTTRVMRLGITAQGDSPPLVFVGQTGNCVANGLANDAGSCVNGSDGNSWKASFSGQVNAAYFGLKPASIGFHTLTTVAGSCAVTDASGGWSTANVGEWIVAAGAGPNELYYISTVATVTDATHFTVTAPCPTLAMEAAPVVVHHGFDNAAAINAAAIAANARKIGMRVPGGEYLVASPIQCNLVNYNNFNLGQPTCTGEPGTIIKAVTSMSGSLPDPNTVFTTGGYANSTDFSQYMRSTFIEGGGLLLDCSFIANDGFGLPFSLDSGFKNITSKNCLRSGFHVGSAGAPVTTGGIFISDVHVERDILYNTINDITRATQPVVTTARDHGCVTGRTVTITGANNVPSPGPISFICESITARTLKLHNVDSSAWAVFSGTAQLSLPFPTNALPEPVFAVTAANPAKISTQGNLNRTNGQRWCIIGLGVSGANGTTGPPTNVPDGPYIISNNSAPGGDGPFEYTVPVNSAGITFTGGGITYRCETTVADTGIFLDNTTDAQVTDSAITGTRWGIYNNIALIAGYNGKYSHVHLYNQPEHGWITEALTLGGSNSLLGIQIDTPTIIGVSASAGGNSSTGLGFNGSFPYVYDGRSWVFRLNAGAIADGAFTATGTNANGYSGSIRANLLSNNFMAGRPDYFGPISNYTQFGFGNPNNTILYPMPDFGVAKPVIQGTYVGTSVDTTNTSPVSSGLTACLITPRFSGLLKLEANATISNNTVGSGVYAQLYYGTGTPPAAGAAFGGGVLTLGNARGFLGEPTGGVGFRQSVHLGGQAIAVTKNVQYWFMPGFRLVGSGTATIGDADCNGIEE